MSINSQFLVKTLVLITGIGTGNVENIIENIIDIKLPGGFEL